jgi:hypothetical protein
MPTQIPKPKKVKLRAPQATTRGASVKPAESKLKEYGRQLGKPKMPKMTTVSSDEGMMALQPVKPTKLK